MGIQFLWLILRDKLVPLEEWALIFRGESSTSSFKDLSADMDHARGFDSFQFFFKNGRGIFLAQPHEGNIANIAPPGHVARLNPICSFYFALQSMRLGYITLYTDFPLNTVFFW